MKTKEIIKKCGGAEAITKELRLSTDALNYWIYKARYGIPQKWHNKLIALAKKQGNELTKYDFVE